MKKRILSLLAIACLLLFLPSMGGAQSTTVIQSGTESAVQENTAPMTVIPLNDALDREFRPLHETMPDGPNIHVLEGDPLTGSSQTLFRFGHNYAGSGNLHFHTHDYRLWLIEGALKHWNADGNEESAPILLPGSYVYQPADLLHAANCLTERCIAYVMFDGPIETVFPEDISSSPEDR